MRPRHSSPEQTTCLTAASTSGQGFAACLRGHMNRPSLRWVIYPLSGTSTVICIFREVSAVCSERSRRMRLRSYALRSRSKASRAFSGHSESSTGRTSEFCPCARLPDSQNTVLYKKGRVQLPGPLKLLHFAPDFRAASVSRYSAAAAAPIRFASSVRTNSNFLRFLLPANSSIARRSLGA